jgi:hypothetical protein
LNDKIEMLIRETERWKIITDIQSKISNCDEDIRECDVCVGLQYAINAVKLRLENE